MNTYPEMSSVLNLENVLKDLNITGLHFHSGKVKQGDLFIAIPGTHTDGHQYIDQAISNGAAAVIGEQNIPSVPVPYFQVSNSRRVLAQLAAQYYQFPAQKHTVIGITGTNGKTSTAYMLQHIVQKSGTNCSLFGTVEHIVNGNKIPSQNTTPDALHLHKWMHESKDPVVIMEVSSHGIDQERVHGIELDYAAFTNLSHDHLNYHPNMHTYFEVKSRLFKHLKPSGMSVVNQHDVWGKRLIGMLRKEKIPLKSFGQSESDHIQLLHVDNGWQPVFQIRENDRMHTIRLPLPGLHNIANAMTAFLIARNMGIDAQTIIEALQTFPGIPGRIEKYVHPRGAAFIIDYAHSPHGLEHCLRTLKNCGATRLTHIFGFRGNGDPSKREKMVRISAQYCHTIILTMDDLEHVTAVQMLSQLRELSEVIGKQKCTIIEDRTQAIQYAWERAQEKDWVVITGKGPETYQQSFQLPAQSDRDTLLYLARHST